VSRLLDECTLEIDVNRSDTLNQIYSQLSAAGIRVRSMRNKSNRLEQLFINLVGQSPVRANGK